jgi:hypothetical protein
MNRRSILRTILLSPLAALLPKAFASFPASAKSDPYPSYTRRVLVIDDHARKVTEYTVFRKDKDVETTCTTDHPAAVSIQGDRLVSNQLPDHEAKMYLGPTGGQVSSVQKLDNSKPIWGEITSGPFPVENGSVYMFCTEHTKWALSLRPSPKPDKRGNYIRES